jgi:uncharacterized membrane protein
MSPLTSQDAGQAHLDTYLNQVQRHLGGLPHAEAREAIAELRSHVLDKVEGAPTPQRVEAAIAELGSPREVARLNLTERVVAELETNRSPWRVLRAVIRLAGLSLDGAFTGLVSLFGYALAAGLLITAIIKPFAWRSAGLWRVPNAENSYSWHLGVTNQPGPGQELLGVWIIPIGLLGGLLIGWCTWRFGISSARRMRRAAQRGRA